MGKGLVLLIALGANSLDDLEDRFDRQRRWHRFRRPTLRLTTTVVSLMITLALINL
jgi:hypothetical protein